MFITPALQFQRVKNRNLGFQRAVGNHIKSLRLQLEWSQSQLASVSHIDETQISRIENGTQSANLRSIIAIAAALGKQPHDLLNVGYKIEVNTDFSVHHRKVVVPDTTRIINKLAKSDFLVTPRTVNEIITQCKKTDQVTLKSPATSGALKKLIAKKVLKRTQINKSGKYVYQLRKRKS